tara:strand:+ start:2635 stop:3861 length:1227 start_codon:yes stop_codon:yes gene_type:complete
MNTLIKKQTLFSLLLGMLLTTLAPIALAQESDSDVTSKGSRFGNTVREIFMQGSIDGNHMFMVLGFEDAAEIAGDAARNAIDIENLRDIRRDVQEAGSDVVQGLWNSDHDGDMVDAVRAGARFSSSQAKKILANPLKSLKKIPGAYKTQFQHAREAYYETDNQILASVQYAGHAVWANVEGAYYLVIEAPIRMATHLLGAVIGVPGTVALQAAGIALRFTIDAIGLTFKIGGHLLKTVANVAVGVASLVYSGVSTGVAIAATSIAAGTVGAINGIGWLISAPVKIWNGTYIKLQIEKKDRTLEEVTKLLSEDDISILSVLGVRLDDVIVSGDEFKKEIKMLKVFGSKLKTAATIKIARKSGKFEVKANLANRLIKELRQSDDGDLSRREFKKHAKAEFEAMILKKLGN